MQDQKTENWLKKEGVEFTYRSKVKISLIDQARSSSNQARIGEPIIEELVESYALAMGQGDEFPAVVAYESHDGKHVLIDGNHTVMALRRIGRKVLDAYVVHSDDAYTIDVLTRTANCKEGLRESMDKRLEHAKWTVRHYGRPIKEVAARFQVSNRRLSSELRIDETLLRLTKLGIDTKPLTKTTVERVGSINDDPVVVEAINVAVAAGLTTDEINRLVADINAVSSQAQRLGEVQKLREDPDIQQRIRLGGRKKRMRTERTQLFSCLRQLENLLAKDKSASELQMINSKDIARLREAITNILSGLSQLLTEAEEKLPV